MAPRKDERAGNVKLLKQTGGTAKKPVGSWRVRLPLGRDQLTGSPRNLERRVHGTEADAWDLLNQMRTQPKAKARSLAPWTIAEMLEDYVEHLDYLGRQATTLASYRAHASRINKAMGARRIGTVTRHDIDLFYRQLIKVDGLSPNTLRRYHTVLTGAFKRAQSKGLLLEDALLPTDRVELPSMTKYTAKTVDVAGALAVMALVRAEDPQMALALGLSVATGCRRGEVCGLQWHDVERVGGVWRLRVRRSIAQVAGRRWFEKDTKSHQDRAVALDWATVKALAAERALWKRRLRARPGPEAFILADLSRDDTGATPHEPDWLTWGWRHKADELGVKARLHDLRHLHATALLENGVALTTVSRRLGHSKVSTTLDIYSQVSEGKDRESAITIGRLLSGGSQ